MLQQNLDDFNPFEYQCWHYKFDPHSDVEEIPMAELKPVQKHVRSESIKDFLDRSNIHLNSKFQQQ
jgi:hypothetical protein